MLAAHADLVPAVPAQRHRRQCLGELVAQLALPDTEQLCEPGLLHHLGGEVRQAHRVVVARDHQRGQLETRNARRYVERALVGVAGKIADEQQLVVVRPVEPRDIVVGEAQMHVADEGEAK